MDRFTLISRPTEDRLARFKESVREGLTAHPKRLSCAYFYDREGSELFEQICELPEYYLTRAETEILQQHAGEIVASFSNEASIVELGSGSAIKTRLIIEALLKRQEKLRYFTIDISKAALEAGAQSLLGDYPQLEITAVAGD